MIILDYNKRSHAAIIKACVHALRDGKAIAFPTDTAYGLAVDSTNSRAVRRLYKIKGRDFKKPISVIVPSKAYAKKIVQWSAVSERLANRFWPGALTIIAPLRRQGGLLQKLTGSTGALGLRLPDYPLARELAKSLGRPITATSANVAGKEPAYAGATVIKQFQKRSVKPDILVDVGKLPQRPVSTVLAVTARQWQVIRPGPVTEKQIKQAFKTKR